MTTETAKSIADAYGWQRGLGHSCVATPHCRIVANPAHPDVWDANHADRITARTPDEIEAVLAAMDHHLPHTSWRVAHTDGFTPDPFLARLAFEGFEERPVILQMALQGDVTDRGADIAMRPVATDADWDLLQHLVILDQAEGRKTGDLALSRAFAASWVAANRAKGADYPYCLVMRDGEAVAYGACAVAPNGVGMIDDLFTLPFARRTGIATGLIAAFVDRLRAAGCETIFLGALATEPPRRLYARLGFRPVALARSWVRDTRVPT